ncbi:MAG: nitrate/sulfonate/bicarbonate transporter substrate-binding protein [Rhodospirillales bacterium]|jgi:NitT/TauT family transport system substrate-binding protein|nr:nitrate/sulfonate/bicarbonate transporter substrate-binding protein [Rhodospirillales bacterium]
MEQLHRRFGRRPVLIGIAAAAASVATGRPATAAERLRVGKSLADLFAYTPVDVAIAKGYYERQNIDIEIIAFQGAAKMQQAMVAGAIDFAIGSGSAMINVLKGVPAICIAETTAAPVELGIIVPYDSPAKTADDLKGKKFGIATVGSVTEWAVFELARVKGWTKQDVVTVTVGGNQGNIGALRTHLVDCVLADVGLAFQLEPQKIARLLMPCSDYIPHFIMHAIFASREIADGRPEAVRGFLKGWFEGVAYMRANRDEAIAMVRKITELDRSVQERQFDLVMPEMSSNGRFNAKGLATIARSFVDLGVTDKEPDMTLLYTEKFLPKL